jgi:hypothetical protein
MILLTEKPWKKITAAVRRTPGNCFVAVAYFGQGGSELLPLKRGSILVVDFSEAAVRTGRVSPKEIQILLKRGVEVHSVANLHAKVFVVGDAAFVGSTNVSGYSANTLVEAVVKGTARRLVGKAKTFVKSLRGEQVTPEFAGKMAKIYRPPKFGGRGLRKSGKIGDTPIHAPTWVVQLEPGKRTPEARFAEKKGRAIARRGLRSSSRFEVDDFDWEGNRFDKRVNQGHLVVQVLEASSGHFLVSPPERVLHVKRYRTPDRKQGYLVFLEKPLRRRRKTLKRLRQILGKSASLLRPNSDLAKLTDAKFIHHLYQLWPGIS